MSNRTSADVTDFGSFSLGALTGLLSTLSDVQGTQVMVIVTGSDPSIKYLLNRGRGAESSLDFKLACFSFPDKQALEDVKERFDTAKTSGMSQLMKMTDKPFMSMFLGDDGESEKSAASEPSAFDCLQQWQTENWGSPTDTKDVKIDQRFEHVEIQFRVARPPLLAFQKLSEDFPELTFEMRLAAKSSVHDSMVFQLSSYVFQRGQMEQKEFNV